MENSEIATKLRREFERTSSQNKQQEFLLREAILMFQSGHTSLLTEIARLNQRIDMIMRAQLELMETVKSGNIDDAVNRLNELLTETTKIIEGK
jgi:hypothetical protein